MFTPSKATLELATKIRLADNETAAVALKVHGAMHRLADVTDMATIYAFAVKSEPTLPLQDALSKLLQKLELASDDVARFKAKFKEIESAEKLRLAPLRSGATDRLFQVVGQLNALASSKLSQVGQDVAKRKNLEAAGLSKDQIDALTPPYDDKAAQAEVDALTAERTALEGFLRHGDELMLPIGFVPQPRIKASIPFANEIPVSARPILRGELV